MSALTKIRNAGFQIGIDSGDLLIEPGDKLTKNQLAFLKSHKSEIIAELELTVTCYTPAGVPIEVQARDADHAAWLLRMNPKPKPKDTQP